MTEIKWSKWLALGLGGIVGVSHIGMIGLLSNRESKLPSINVPVGPYTSYNAEVNRDGYKISYRANDPKVMRVERDVKKKGGFLGLANNTEKIVEQYTMDGSLHTKPNNEVISEFFSNRNSKSEECIKAIGGAEQTGRLVGSSVGASVAPSVASIPIIGWVAAGWVTMFSGNQGAEIGGGMAEDLNKNC